MIRYLLPREGHYYKANLHAHSTLSDGSLEPAALKVYYKEHGYSVLAITDHEYMVRHNDLNDPDFLILNGYETYIHETMEAGKGRFKKTVHMNLIAPNAGEDRIIMADPVYMRYAARYGNVEELPRDGELCTRQYTAGDVNRLLRRANAAGYLVFYNHPSWSREVPEVVAQYQGFMGMEVYNHGCRIEGYPGDDSRFFDSFLRAGRRLACFANDDNHNHYQGTQWDDSFGGFNMIKAPELTYQAVINAIRDHSFYCSSGALINDYWIEDDIVHITFPEAREVILVTEGRPAAHGRHPSARCENGVPLTEAQFRILPDDGFFRIEVTDMKGQKAYTQPVFLEDLR